MKILSKIVAMKLAVGGLALTTLTVPARARQVAPHGLGNHDGLQSLDGVCPSIVPCVSNFEMTFIGIGSASGIDSSNR
jgi:hypothetical protein